MKLINRTRYDTRALRRIVTAVHGVMAKTEGRLPTWRTLRVHVETGRPKYHEWAISGRADLNGGWVLLRLPRPDRHHVSANRLAWLVEHELYHAYGRRHGTFREESPEWWTQHVGCDPVPLRRPPAPRDVVGERRLRAERLLRKWERRLKLARTKVRQYQKQVRYYERARPVLTAAGAAPSA